MKLRWKDHLTVINSRASISNNLIGVCDFDGQTKLPEMDCTAPS